MEPAELETVDQEVQVQGIIEHLREFMAERAKVSPEKQCRAVELSMHCAEFLKEQGLSDGEVKYDFEYTYRVYFNIVTPMVAEFWDPWAGGVSWRIVDA